MMGLTLSRRMRIILIAMLVVGLLLFLPMRIAIGLTGLERMGLAARQVDGSIWGGRLHDLVLDEVRIGTVDAALSPWPLLIGRARFDIARQRGAADDIRGAMTMGIGGRIGIDDATGTVSLGRALAPLPIGSFALDDVSATFAGGHCAHAEGRVRAFVTGRIAGLNLSQGLSGAAACDGEVVLLPLVSQSGMEKMTLRLWQTGRYKAEMRVETSDVALAAALGAAGFAGAGNAQVLTVEGSL